MEEKKNKQKFPLGPVEVAAAQTPKPPSLGFGMRFESDRCYLYLRNRKVIDSINIRSLLIFADGLSYPYDVSRGSDGFADVFTQVEDLDWSLGMEEINDYLLEHSQELFENFRNIKVKIDDGVFRIYGTINQEGSEADFSFKLAAAGEGARRAVFYCYDFKVYGWLPIPPPVIAVKLFERLSSFHFLVENVSKIIFDPHKLIFNFLLPIFGWKFVRYDELYLDRVGFLNRKVYFSSSNNPPTVDDSLAIASDLKAIQISEASMHFRDAERLMSQNRFITAYKAYLYHGRDNPSDNFLISRIAGLLSSKEEYLEKGAQYCRSVLDYDPNFFETLNTLANIYARQGKVESAKDCYAKMMPLLQTDQSPQDEAYLYLAIGSLSERDSTEAIDSYEKVLERDYSNPRALQALAPLYLLDGQVDASLETLHHLSEVVSDPEKLVPTNLEIGDIYRKRLRRFEKAEDYYQKVLRTHRNHPEALLGLADTLKMRGKFSTAIRMYDELGEGASSSNDMKLLSRTHFEVGQIWQQDLDTVQNAILRYRRSLETDPSNSAALYRLIDYYKEKQQWRQVAATYQLAIQGEQLYQRPADLVNVLFALGDIHFFKLNDAQRAVYFLERALRYQPDHLDSLNSLIEIHEKTGNYLAAVDGCERLLAVFENRQPQDASAISAQHLKIAEIYGDRLDNDKKLRAHLLRSLKYDPEQQQAFSRLAKIFIEEGKWSELNTVYNLRVVHAEEPEKLFNLYYAMAEIQLYRLDNKKEAARLLKKALEARPNNVLVLSMLADIQRESGDWKGLVESIEGLIASSESKKMRFELLTELADIWMNRLLQPENSLSAYERIFQLDPDNRQAIDLLSYLYEKRGDWIKYADMLYAQARLETNSVRRSEIFTRAAEHWLEKISYAEEAINNYRKALIANPGNIQAFEGLRSLYQQEKRYGELVELLVRQGEIVQDTMLASSFYHSAANIADNLLGDKDRAIDIYYRIIQIDMHDREALAELTKLYEQQENWSELVKTLELNLQITDDEHKQFEQHMRLGNIYHHNLQNWDSAIEHFNRAIAIESNSRRALQGLTEVYRDVQDWRRFFALREKLVALVGPEEKINLHFENGEILHNVLGNLPQAITHFWAVLEIDPDNVRSMNHLLDIYDKQGDYQRAIATLNRLIHHSEEYEQRIKYNYRLAEIYKERLDDLEGAVACYKSILMLDVTQVSALDHLINIYRSRADHSAEVEYVNSRIELAREGEEAIELLSRAADLYQVHLNRTDDAAAALIRILAIEPLHPIALRRLEPILRKQERWEELFSILEKRRQIAENDREKASFALAKAQLLFEKLDRVNTAASSYREVLELDQENIEAFQGLEEIYQADGNWQALSELLEDKVSRGVGEDSERVEACMTLADIYKRRFDDDVRAIKFLEAGRKLRPANQTILNALATLYEQNSLWEGLVGVLAQQRSLSENPEQQKDLSMRIGMLLVDKLKLEKEAERYFVAVLKTDPLNDTAFEKVFAYYFRNKLYGKMAPMLSNRAAVLDNQPEKAFWYFWSGWVSRYHLKEINRALGMFEKARENFDGFWPALVELGEIYEENGAWEDLVLVWGEQVKRAETTRGKLGLLLKSARVYDKKIGRPEDAVDAYRKALEISPNNSIALKDLGLVFEKLERFEDLEGNIRVRLKLDLEDDERVGLLLKLENLLNRKAGKEDEQIELLVEILKLDPKSEAALGRLEKYYSMRRQWNELVGLYRQRIENAEDRDTKVFLHVREAEILDRQLSDSHEAIRILKSALRINPDYLPAIEKLAEIYMRHERWPEAAALYSTALQSPTANRLRVPLLSQLARLQRDYLNLPDEAYANYLEILETDADHTEGLRSAADYEFERNYWRLASERYELLLRQEKVRTDGEASAIYWRRIAIARREEGAKREAVAAFEKAISFNSMSTESYIDLADLHYELGDDEKAAAIYTEVVDRFGADIHDEQRSAIYCNIGRIKLAAGEHEQARVNYGFASAANSNSVEAAFNLATLHAEGNDNSEALGYFRLLVEKFSEELSAEQLDLCLAEKARIEYIEGDYKAARRSFERVIERDPKNIAAAAKLRKVYRMLADWTALGRHLENMVEAALLPSEKKLYNFELAVVEYSKIENTGQAAERLNEQLRDDPAYNPARLYLARIYRRIADFNQLSALLEDSLARITSGKIKLAALMELGEVYHQKLRLPEKAIDYYNQALELSPSDPRALDALETLYNLTGKIEQLAEVMIEQAKLIDDSDLRADHYKKLAEILYEHGDSKPAADAYEQSLVARPGDRAILETLTDIYEALDEAPALIDVYRARIELAQSMQVKATLSLKAGRVCIKKKDLVEFAPEFFSNVLAHDPENIEAFIISEEYLLATGQYSRLINLYKTIGESTEDAERKSTLYESAAEICIEKLKEYGQAGELLRKALTIDERKQSLWKKYAENAERLSDYDAVGEAYRKLVSFGADEETLVEMKIKAAESFYQAGRAIDAAPYYIELGEAEAAAENYAVAADLMEKALDADNSNRMVLEKLRNIYSGLGETYKLSATLQRELELAESPADLAELNMELGRALQRIEGLEDVSIQHYLAALEADPTNQTAWTAAEKFYRDVEDYSDLVELLEKKAAADTDMRRSSGFLLDAAGIAIDKLKEYRRADRLLKSAVELDPSNEEVWRNLADNCLRIEDFEGVAGSLNKLITFGGDPALMTELRQRAAEAMIRAGKRKEASESYLALAAKEKEAGRAEAAAGYFEKALAAEPADYASLDELDKIYRLLEDNAKLSSVLMRKIDLATEPDKRSELNLELGFVLAGIEGRRTAAVGYFLSALKENPQNKRALAEAEKIYRADGDFKSLADLLASVAATDKNSEVAGDHMLRAAQIYIEKLEDYQKADEVLRTATDINDDSELLWKTFAENSERIGQNNQAARAYQRLIEFSRDDNRIAELQRKAADAFSRSGESEKGAQLYRSLANAAIKSGEMERAVDLLEKVLLAEPESLDVLDKLEALYFRLDKIKEATNIIRRKITVSDDEHKLSDLHLRLGESLLKIDPISREASEELRHSINYNATNERAIELLENYYRDSNDSMALIDMWIAAAEKSEGEQAASLFYKAGEGAGELLNDYQQAVGLLAKSIKHNEENEDAWEKYAEFTRRTGDYATSAEAWVKLLEFGADLERAMVLELNAAEAYYATGNYASAAPLFRSVAEVEIEEDQFEAAAEHLEKSIAGDGDNLEVLDALSQLFVQLNNEQKQIYYLGKVVELENDPQKLSAMHLRLGSLILKTGDEGAKSIDHFRSSLKANPANDRALIEAEKYYQNLGEDAGLATLYMDTAATAADQVRSSALYLKAGRLYEKKLQNAIKAGEAYEKAYRANEENIEPLRSLAEISYQLSEYARAVEAWEKLAALSSEAGDRVSYLEKAAAAYAEKLGKPAKAVELSRRLLELAPNDESVQTNLLKLLRKAGDATGLIEALEEFAANEEGERGIKHLRELARLRENAGEKEKAIECYLDIYKRDRTDADALNSLKGLYYKLEKYNEIYHILERIIENRTDTKQKAEASIERAKLAEEKLERVDLAAADYQKAFSFDSDNTVAADSLLRIYKKNDRWTKLPPIYERLIEFAEDRTRRSELEAELGDVYYYNIGDEEQALNRYARANQYNPDNTEIISRLLTIYQERGDEKKALQYRKQLIDRGSENMLDVEKIEMYETAARQEMQQGLDEEAFEHIEQLVRLKADSAKYRFWYAELAIKLNHTEKGYDAYKSLDTEFADQLDREKRTQVIESLATLDEQFGFIGSSAANRERLLEINPTRQDEFEWLANYFLETGENERLMPLCEKYQKLLLASTRRDKVLETLVSHASETEGLETQAEKFAEIIVETRPEDDAAIETLEQIYRSHSNVEGIVKTLGKRIARSKDQAQRSMLLKERSFLNLERIKNYDEAAADLEEILRIEPENLKAYDALVKCYRAKEDYNSLSRTYENLVRVDKLKSSHLFKSAHLALADIYMTKLSNPALAAQTLEHQVDEGADDVETRRKLVRIFNERLEDPENATRHAAKIIEMQPFDLDGYIDYVGLAEKMDDDDKVHSFNSLARLVNPTHPTVINYFNNPRPSTPDLNNLKFATPRALASMLLPSQPLKVTELLLTLAEYPALFKPEKATRNTRKKGDLIDAKRFPTLGQLTEDISLFLLNKKIEFILAAGLGKPFEVYPASNLAIINSDLLKALTREETIFMICQVVEHFGRHLIAGTVDEQDVLAAELSKAIGIMRNNFNADKSDSYAVEFVAAARKAMSGSQLQALALQARDIPSDQLTREGVLKAIRQMALASSRSSAAIARSPYYAATALLKMYEPSGRVLPVLSQSGIEKMFTVLRDQRLREEVFDIFRFAVNENYFKLLSAIAVK